MNREQLIEKYKAKKEELLERAKTASDKDRITLDIEITDCMLFIQDLERVEELINDSDLKHIQDVIEVSFKSENYHKTNPYFIHSKNIFHKIKNLLERTIKFPLKEQDKKEVKRKCSYCNDTGNANHNKSNLYGIIECEHCK